MKSLLASFVSFIAIVSIVCGQEPSSSAAVASAPPPKIPLRDFFKNPESRGYLLSPDGKTLSYLAPWESRMNIWVRPTTGEMKMAAQNPGHVDHWVNDHKGRILAATETDGVNATLLTRPDEKAPFKKVLTTNFREHLGVQFFTFDNKQLYAASNIGRDKQAIVTIDPATGKETGMIYENPDVDVDALAFSKKRKVLTHAEY